MFLKEQINTISEWKNVCPNRLDAAVLDLWRIHIPSVQFEKIESHLSAEEKNRAGKYKFEKDRNSFAVSRSALRLILSAYLTEIPRNLNFVCNPFGKPSLNLHTKREIYFNVSHSGEFALIAVGCEAEIGIDIELMKELDYLSLAESIFSDQEQSELKSLPENHLRKGFYTLWTRKEAFIKAIGLGLSFSLKEFDVSLISPEKPQIKISRSQAVFDTGWEIYDLLTDVRYCASLVIPANKFAKIRAFDFDLKQFGYA